MSIITSEERVQIEAIMTTVKEMDDIYVTLELIRRLQDLQME